MEGLIEEFRRSVKEDSELPLPVASIQMLTHMIKKSKASTMAELAEEIEKASRKLEEETSHSIPVTAGCELFLRLLTRTALDVTVCHSCLPLLACLPASFLPSPSLSFTLSLSPSLPLSLFLLLSSSFFFFLVL